MRDAPARSALFEMTRARQLEFFRDPGTIFWVFGFPIVLAVVLGIAFRARPPDPVRVAVVGSDAAMAALPAPGFAAKLLSEGDAARALKTTGVDLVVVDDGVGYAYRFDESRPEARLARAAVDAALQRAAGRADAFAPKDEKVVLPGSRYIDFLIPGLIGMNLLGSSMWGVGYSIVDARRRKLLKRYAATPMRRYEYLLSVLLSRLMFLLVELVALVAIGELLFGVHVQGSWLSVFLIALIGGASFTGISLLIAARAKSTETASGWINFVMMPMWLLSGSFFSAERFPAVVQPVIQALPLTAMNDAMRGVYNDGSTLLDVSPQLGILIAWGLIPFVLALRNFRWQ